MKFRVLLVGYANATVVVEAPEGTPAEELVELAEADAPRICAQCSGWGQPGDLELGDEWEANRNEDGTPIIEPEDD